MEIVMKILSNKEYKKAVTLLHGHREGTVPEVFNTIVLMLYNDKKKMFSAGGSSYNRWSKSSGKVWRGFNRLKSHLTMLREGYYFGKDRLDLSDQYVVDARTGYVMCSAQELLERPLEK